MLLSRTYDSYDTNMGLTDPKTLMPKLNLPLRRKLVVKLQIDDNWKKLAEFLPVLGHETVQRLRCFSNPAERLVEELECLAFPVHLLTFALKRQELYDALALFIEREPLVITRQPGDGSDVVRVSYGETLELQCSAEGFPPPKEYQWFFNNHELSNGKSNKLIIENFELGHQGEYSCLIKQDETSDGACWTNEILVEVLPDCPFIVEEPQPVVCIVGEEFKLQCSVDCYPVPNFQWYRENEALDGETSDILMVNNASLKDEGLYKCHISNMQAEVFSKEVKVKVYPEPNAEYELRRQLLPRKRVSVPAKVALLIGNSLYQRDGITLRTSAESSRLTDLVTPCNDVETLSFILTQMEFKVLALHNLTKTEMRNAVKLFCSLLHKGCFGVFYFAGHGFECDDKFMLPVDAPESGEYLRGDCISERDLLCSALEKEPKLLLVILDMCLIVPQRDENPAIFAEKCYFPKYTQNRNIIRAYATSSNLKSFERKFEKNGLYVKYLKEWLGYDLPVLTILNKVSEEFQKNEPDDTTNRMMPSVYYNTSTPHFLTDPVDEHEETKALYESITLLPTTELKFECASQSTPVVAVDFKRHRNCFLNSIEITVSNPQNWTLQFTTMDLFQGVQRQVREEDGCYLLTITGLQKIKNAISFGITFHERSTQQLLASAVLDLGTPLIVPARLWYNPHEAALEQLYRL